MALNISIIQRVTEFLGLSAPADAMEMYGLLREYRETLAPDALLDEDVRKRANDKLQEVEKLIQELLAYWEAEQIATVPAQLVARRADFERVHFQHSLDVAKREIVDLKQQLEMKQREVDLLTQSLKEAREISFHQEIKDLEALFMPTYREWASLGIVAVLALAVGTMTKIDEIAHFLQKYSPVGDLAINYVVFATLVSTSLLVGRQAIELQLIRKRIRQVCSSHFASGFMEYLDLTKSWEDSRQRKFSEGDVLEYLGGKESYGRKIMRWLGFRTYSIETAEELKDCFISYLLTRKVIGISIAAGLNRTFSVRSSPYDYDF